MTVMMLNLGFGNAISERHVIAILDYHSAPAQRLVSNAREEKTVVDATSGRTLNSVITTDTNQIVLSAIKSDTLINRLSSGNIRIDLDEN